MKAADLKEELGTCAFGDERLTKRCRRLAELLGEKPNISLPAALKTRADVEGCYRFFNNDGVTPESILQPHIECTRQRVAAMDFVLLVQDTTEIDLTRPEEQVQGAGPIDCESRRGAFFHPMIAFDREGVPLGLVGQQIWTRESISQASDLEKLKVRRKTPIEEKESYRWLQGVRWAEDVAAHCPQTTCVVVGDSESDIYDIFTAVANTSHRNLALLIRAGQNRNTTDGQDWLEFVRATSKIGDQTVAVRARTAKTGVSKTARTRTRDARTAELEIRKATIQLRRPANGGKRLPESIPVNVVLCEEVDPPPGEDPIRWMLVTSLPIDSDYDVQQVISGYCVRWQIEVYFRTLKSGCRVEHRRFETIDRVLNCLAFFSVVAWRVMHLCHLGRKCPDLNCEVIFEPSEWKSVYAILKLAPPPHGCPTLNELIRAIARLGGFIDRSKSEPGTQTLWIGLQRCYDLSNAWNTFGPGAKKFSPN